MKKHIVLSMNALLMVIFSGVVLSGQTPDLAKLFPDMVGWQKKGSAEIFFPENLYEYIDGAAENFLSYGFEQLAVQNYTNDQGQALSAEIYFHGAAENAFGIYGSEKPTAGKYFALGSQGYAEDGIFNFICSAYYIKLNGFNLGSNGQEIFLTLGRAIAGKIDAKAALPEILQAFPMSGKIPNSERFILNNFLGHDFLHKAYTADYQVQGQPFQLFIISSGSESEARTMLENYAALDKEKPVLNIQPGALTIHDPYNGPLQIFWRETFIWGIIGQTPTVAEYMEIIGKNLAKQ